VLTWQKWLEREKSDQEAMRTRRNLDAICLSQVYRAWVSQWAAQRKVLDSDRLTARKSLSRMLLTHRRVSRGWSTWKALLRWRRFESRTMLSAGQSASVRQLGRTLSVWLAALWRWWNSRSEQHLLLLTAAQHYYRRGWTMWKLQWRRGRAEGMFQAFVRGTGCPVARPLLKRVPTGKWARPPRTVVATCNAALVDQQQSAIPPPSQVQLCRMVKQRL